MKPLSFEIRNSVLTTMADKIERNASFILDCNQQDLNSLVEPDSTIYDRLVLDSSKIALMAKALRNVASQDDPIGKVLDKNDLPNGLVVINQTVPFGTIFIIYESRPDVTIEAASLGFKAGNRILLKGGKESFQSNKALISCWKESLNDCGVSDNWIELFDFNREQTQAFLQNPDTKLDLVVPRGGETLIAFVKKYAICPVIVSGRGNNFAYISEDADWQKVKNVILNAKTQKVSACNALDKILIDQNVPSLKTRLTSLIDLLQENNVQVEYDNDEGLPVKGVSPITGKEVWSEEFLALRIAIKVIDGLDDAIEFINRYSGGHSAVIFTENDTRASTFMDMVDCGAVYQNASTRFTDGGQLGIGAELAISTDKLHHRGPLGLANLVTNKYYIFGNGQTRE